MPSTAEQIVMAMTALAPIVGRDNIAKLFKLGLKKGGKVKAKRAKKVKAKKTK
jgi:fumarate hydratase class II